MTSASEALTSDMEWALTVARSKLAHNPDDPTLQNALGVIAGAEGDPARALVHFDRALALCPTYAEAHVNRGLALEILGRTEEALQAFTTACELTPDYVEAEQKVESLSNALTRTVPPRAWPEPSWLHRGMQGLLSRRSASKPHPNHDELSLRARLRGKRSDVPSLLALANVLKNAKRAAEAECFLRYSQQYEPDNAGLAIMLALLLDSTQRKAEAAAVLSRFESTSSDDDRLFPLLLRLRADLCDWDGYHELYEKATNAVRRTPGAIEPFAALSLWDDQNIQALAATAFAARNYPPQVPMVQVAHSGPRAQRLRVGYLSGDFHQNAVASLVAEVFELHDRDRISVHAYAVGPDDGSSIYQRIAAACDSFQPLWRKPAREIAGKISSDRIDVLIDLSGYTRHGRPDVLALRPAPIQVNNGQAATMGASFMDYIIADCVVIPEVQPQFYAEKVVRLAQPFQPNDRKRPLPRAPRKDFGLGDDEVVFCSFSTPSKISPTLFTIWMRILAQVPDSILWLRGWSPDVNANLQRTARMCGISSERLLFAENCDYETHLSRYSVVDLALDTFAHGGHTTASDALWQGCPIVTCTGQTFSARVGTCLLQAAGLPEFVTGSPAEYEALIVRLGLDRKYLRSIRGRLEATRYTCALFDSPATTRQLEWAYQRMWHLHIAGEAPQAFDVPSDLR